MIELVKTDGGLRDEAGANGMEPIDAGVFAVKACQKGLLRQRSGRYIVRLALHEMPVDVVARGGGVIYTEATLILSDGIRLGVKEIILRGARIIRQRHEVLYVSNDALIDERSGNHVAWERAYGLAAAL